VENTAIAQIVTVTCRARRDLYVVVVVLASVSPPRQTSRTPRKIHCFFLEDIRVFVLSQSALFVFILQYSS
jgi:hypothetical protein